MSDEGVYGMGDVAERTGVAEGTLRMWERRHGFPTPARRSSGHRRYTDRDVELIRRVAAQRAAGYSLAAAIDRARGQAGESSASVYATLRRRRPDLEPRTIAKPIMLALAHAIEDETLARAERPILFGSFQRERFYRQAQPRWRELTRGAELAVVFADFERLRTPRDAPAEVPVARAHPLNREWTLVCEGEDFAVCLTGWEPPDSSNAVDRERRFETIWSVAPEVVREASAICAAIADAARPALLDPVRPRLDSPPSLSPASQVHLATAVTARMLSRLSMRLIHTPGSAE
jgi:DICT domain-containing protein